MCQTRIGIEVLLTWHNTHAPATPTPIDALLFPRQILSVLPLVLILLNDCPDLDSFLDLLLHYTPNTLNLLRHVAGPAPMPPLAFDLLHLALDACQFVGITVDLLLDLPCCKAFTSSSAFDAFVAFTDACAKTTEVGAVASAPGPTTSVSRVGAAKGISAGEADVDHIRTAAGAP